MTNKQLMWLIAIVIVIGAAVLSLNKKGTPPEPEASPTPTVSATATPNPDISVSAPLPNSVITSPLTILGQARGPWYFEASFPIRLLDGNDVEIATTTASALSDWMTTNFVPFQATLIFTPPSTPSGTLVLEKDNPSDLPQNADEVRIPVLF
ncbi:MAG: Gmad2 immunoglobulin-like domain-containing protein [Parcubacteria group bacterium]|nr:Gmad2 immunoglobulin-like domain-containing protein [Parcubacteria group bacterium]